MQQATPELATEWFDGRSPRPHAAWVRCEGGELVVRLQDGEGPCARRYALPGIRWPERRVHGLRQTELPDGSLIQHANAREWDAWAQCNNLRESAVVGWMQSWRGALGAMVATAFVLAVAWVWGVPAIAAVIAKNIPTSIEARIGEVSLHQLRNLFLKPSELPAATQAKLRESFAQWVRNAYPEGNAPQWQLAFHKSQALGPNAFALPGGHIVVTDELVMMLHDLPDATLGVMAHELGHVQHRHGLDLMVRASLVSALLGVVIGDASGFLASVPVTLVTQAYSRDAERQSDARAAAMLHANGKSPAVMAIFFERLRTAQPVDGPGTAPLGKGPQPTDQEGEDAALPIAISSHPDLAERIRYFKSWTAETDGNQRRPPTKKP
jgi:Zn-dependent protease with chaperone function